MIDENALIARARGLLTEKPEAAEFARGNLRLLIPLAVTMLYDRKESDREFARNFITETAPVQIDGDQQANALSQIDAVGIIPSAIKGGDIILDSLETPPIKTVQMVKTLDRLKMAGRQDAFMVKCYLSGTLFTFKHPTLDLNGTSFKVRGECVSRDISALPSSLEGALALIIAELAPKQGKPNDQGLQIQAQRV